MTTLSLLVTHPAGREYFLITWLWMFDPSSPLRAGTVHDSPEDSQLHTQKIVVCYFELHCTYYYSGKDNIVLLQII